MRFEGPEASNWRQNLTALGLWDQPPTPPRRPMAFRLSILFSSAVRVSIFYFFFCGKNFHHLEIYNNIFKKNILSNIPLSKKQLEIEKKRF
jgi:hypothetical protein